MLQRCVHRVARKRERKPNRAPLFQLGNMPKKLLATCLG
jgi:hypothetical protein